MKHHNMLVAGAICILGYAFAAGYPCNNRGGSYDDCNQACQNCATGLWNGTGTCGCRLYSNRVAIDCMKGYNPVWTDYEVLATCRTRTGNCNYSTRCVGTDSAPSPEAVYQGTSQSRCMEVHGSSRSGAILSFVA